MSSVWRSSRALTGFSSTRARLADGLPSNIGSTDLTEVVAINRGYEPPVAAVDTDAPLCRRTAA